jgi:hypothetical protein
MLNPNLHAEFIELIIAYTLVGAFVFTVIITCASLIGWVRFADPAQQKKLFVALIVELVAICLGSFSDLLKLNPNQVQKEVQAPLEKKLATATKTIESTKEVVVDFPSVDTASATDFTVAAAPYLHGVGISVTDLKPQQSEVVLKNNRGLYGGAAIIPTTSQNFLTQNTRDNDGIASFTLVFDKSCDSVSFTRPALYAATESGVTHPAWSAHALDAEGREVSSQSEALTISFSNVPSRTYTLNAPGFDGIAAIRFDSDWRLNGKPFAGFRAILIERLILIRHLAATSP